MDAYSIAQVQHDLNDPNSPYYQKGMSVPEQIRNYMRTGATGLNTHYFGANKNMYLAQPTTDTVTLLANTRAKQAKKERINQMITAVAAVGLLLIGRKIPVVNQIPKLVGSTIGFVGKGLGLLATGIGKLLK